MVAGGVDAGVGDEAETSGAEHDNWPRRSAAAAKSLTCLWRLAAHVGTFLELYTYHRTACHFANETVPVRYGDQNWRKKSR